MPWLELEKVRQVEHEAEKLGEAWYDSREIAWELAFAFVAFDPQAIIAV